MAKRFKVYSSNGFSVEEATDIFALMEWLKKRHKRNPSSSSIPVKVEDLDESSQPRRAPSYDPDHWGDI